MAFKMHYHERNIGNLNKLGDKTKAAAFAWYNYLVKEQIEVLVYETIRTKEQQRANIANGKSQTMRSYHLVGQAIDFVPTNGKETLWAGYSSPDAQKAIKKAKALGFTWGGDWKDFVDKPHIQYDRIAYGTDTFTGKDYKVDAASTPEADDKVYEAGESGPVVKEIQKMLVELGYKIEVDGEYGPATEKAVKEFQAAKGLTQNGKVGLTTLPILKLEAKKAHAATLSYPVVGKVVKETGLFNSLDFRTSTRVKMLNVGESYKIYGFKDDKYIVGNAFALMSCIDIK